MGKPGTSGTNKRRADEATDANANKRLLKSNQFAALATDGGGVKKERMPPFYTKGFPPLLHEEMARYSKDGLKFSLRRCTDGYKITVPALGHYRAVEAYLKTKQVEYYTHDMEEAKPFKAILRGLFDMNLDVLEEELEKVGLRPVKAFKIRRQNPNIRYRDQLYLVHFPRKIIGMKELQSTRALFHHIIQWEKYKPVYKEVTQCTNCLNFGHGAKNCHILSRCSNCGENHRTSDCLAEVPVGTCINCKEAHSSTSRSCPKRAEFIQRRKQAQQRNNRTKTPANIDLGSFPPLPPPKHTIPVLPPLQPHKRLAAAAASIPMGEGAKPASTTNPWPQLPPPGFRQQSAPEQPLPDDAPLFTPEQLMPIFQQLATNLRSCKTRYDQIFTLGMFVIQNAY